MELEERLEKAAEALEKSVKETDDLKVQNEQLSTQVTEQAGKVTDLESKLQELTLERKFKPPMGGNGDNDTINATELMIGRKLIEHRMLKGVDKSMPDLLEAQFQTMTSGGSGTGAEMLETVVAPELWRDIYLATNVAKLFATINMPSQTMYLPESLGDVVFYKPAGEGQAVTATDLATARRTLTAYEVKAQVDVGDWLDQDAVVALIPEIRSNLVRNAGETLDELILNADPETGATNINFEGTALASTSRFLIGFAGLIHYALHEHASAWKSDLGTLAIADFPTLISLMGKYGANPDRCALIMDVWTYAKALGLSEFLTMQNYGAQATIARGGLGRPFGMELVVSAQIAKSDATGHVDDTTADNVLGRMLIVNRDCWKVGVRQPVRVATERSEAKGVTSLVCTMRVGLQCFGDRASAKYSHTVIGYNTTIV